MDHTGGTSGLVELCSRRLCCGCVAMAVGGSPLASVRVASIAAMGAMLMSAKAASKSARAW